MPRTAESRVERRHDIDALRVLATLLLIYYHTARAFDGGEWHVKDKLINHNAEILVQFINNWHMPLFFILAGAACRFALQRRTGRAFLVERVSRLFVPLVFGILLVVPPQVYLERIGTAPLRSVTQSFSGSFLAFYPHFFQGIYPTGNFSWHHLWFIVYLFVFSALLLPMFLFLRDHPAGRRLTAWVERTCASPVGLGAAVLPLILVEVALSGAFPPIAQTLIGDWARDAHYILLLIYGYLLVASDAVTTAIMAIRHWTLALAMTLTVALVVVLTSSDWPVAYSGPYFAVYTVYACTEWLWLLTILGYGRRYLYTSTSAWRWASEISYPFYIFHQPVIVVIGYYVLQWSMSPLAKYLIISTAALAVTTGLCELVKHSKATRIMFGLGHRGGPGRLKLQSSHTHPNPSIK